MAILQAYVVQAQLPYRIALISGQGFLVGVQPSKTIRQYILDAMLQVVNNMTDELGNSVWNKTGFGDPLEWGYNELPLCTIDGGNDKVLYQDFYQIRKSMKVAANFQFLRDQQGLVDNYTQFEYYKSLLQLALTANNKLGGAIILQEAGDGCEVEGRNDPRPGGYLLIEVVYRHGRTDPTRTLDGVY